MRDARRSAFFSAGIFFSVSSRKCSALARYADASRRVCGSAFFQKETRMRLRRSESTRSLKIRRAFHIAAAKTSTRAPRLLPLLAHALDIQVRHADDRERRRSDRQIRRFEGSQDVAMNRV